MRRASRLIECPIRRRTGNLGRAFDRRRHSGRCVCHGASKFSRVRCASVILSGRGRLNGSVTAALVTHPGAKRWNAELRGSMRQPAPEGRSRDRTGVTERLGGCRWRSMLSNASATRPIMEMLTSESWANCRNLRGQGMQLALRVTRHRGARCRQVGSRRRCSVVVRCYCCVLGRMMDSIDTGSVGFAVLFGATVGVGASGAATRPPTGAERHYLSGRLPANPGPLLRRRWTG